MLGFSPPSTVLPVLFSELIFKMHIPMQFAFYAEFRQMLMVV